MSHRSMLRVVILTLLVSGPSMAAPGDLVPSFGNKGVAYFNAGFTFTENASNSALKSWVLPDRSVLLASRDLLIK